MLPFFEAFGEYDLPEKLQNELFDSAGKKLERIKNLSKLNIFVGANNSGKSIILREILKTKSQAYYSKHRWSQIQSLVDFYETIIAEMLAAYNDRGLYSISDSHQGQIFDVRAVNDMYILFKNYKSNYDVTAITNHLNNLFSREFKLSEALTYYISDSKNVRHSHTTFRSLKLLTDVLDTLNSLKAKSKVVVEELDKLRVTVTDFNYPKIYIPSIRTLRPFGIKADIAKDTKQEYGLSDSVVVYNGQNFPENVFSLKNSGYTKRQAIKVFEDFLSVEFFESKEVELTYHSEHQVLLIKIGDEQERPIYELGDGLQMIIILTFPFFIYDGGAVGIEEPELFIHPGMQKKILKFLISHPSTMNFQIFIATHSNHIIDALHYSPHISLYSVRKKLKANDESIEKAPDFIFENLAYGHENLLTLLGVTSTSVYLSNCVIWVEGITDKIFIQKFITEYLNDPNIKEEYVKCREYAEGINYSFALTAGDSIIHWDFSDASEYDKNTKNIIVRKFCSKSLVVVDNDFSKNKERKRILKELLEDRLIEHAVPEVENLLNPEVINSAIYEYTSVANAVGDAILPNFDNKSLKSKKLGYIIDEIILKDYPNVKRFSNRSNKGGLKSTEKYSFCLKAVKYITCDNMTYESKQLTERILDFITSKNE